MEELPKAKGDTPLAKVGQIFSGLSQGLSQGLAFGGSSTAVGLSIGSSSIKIAELQKKGKTWKLLHFGVFQLPEDAIVNREIVNQVAVTESLRTLVSQIRLKNKNVCISLSGNALIIKRMQLEVPNLKELQEQVFWEAEQYLPFDVGDVVMDFHMLSRMENTTDVLFVAVKNAFLDSYMSCVSDTGLKPKIVDTDFFALQNVFELNYPVNPSKSVALIDIGASSFKFVVVQSGIPVFQKDVAIGGRSLTTEIQRNLDLSYLDAETLKVSGQGSTMPQEVSDLMQVMADNLAIEAKKAIDFYNASSVGAPIEYILLAGGSAKIPNLSKTIEDATLLPTQNFNPFNAITCDPTIFTQEYLNAIAPIAVIPIGLALRAAAK
jgi:type IV pilus assembly protein PilM